MALQIRCCSFHLANSTELLSSSSTLPASASPSKQPPFVLEAWLTAVAADSGICSDLAAIMPASAAHNLPPVSLCKILISVRNLPKPCVS